MKVELGLPPAGRGDPAAVARRAERLGYDRVTSPETAHDPFLPLALAAAATERVNLASAITVAFARSPVVTAHTSWDLHELSGGRFELGLGTQLKGQIERRYGVRWTDPAPRMKEYVLAVRAVWDSWHSGGGELSFTGSEYRLTLMTPEYSPAPSAHPPPRIYLAGFGPAMVRTAGEVADGLRLPAFMSPKYVRESVAPLLRRVLAQAGRPGNTLELCAQPWLAIGGRDDVARQRERYRRLIAQHGGAKTYRAVWDAHGWGDVAGKLYELTLKREYAAMPRLVSDEMVSAFVVSGAPDEVVAQLRDEWGSLAGTVAFPGNGLDDDALERCLQELRA